MAAVEHAFVATPFAGAGGKVIASPFQFLTDADTYLRVVSANSAPGVVLAIQGRRLDDKGTIQPLNEIHTTNTDRSVKTQDYKLGVGALLNVAVFVKAGTPLIGSTYVLVQLTRNTGAPAIVLGALLAGVVTTSQSLGFPGSPIVDSLSVQPAVRNIVGTLPAPGGQIIETVPTGARWELVGLHHTFTASAAVASRFVYSQFDDAVHIRLNTFPGVSIAASQAFSLSWARNLYPNWDGTNQLATIQLPLGLTMLAGDRLLIGAINIQAGDQFSAPIYQVLERLEVP